MPNGFIEPELNHRAHAAGVKVMLLPGGDFLGLETSGAVETLVDNLAALAKEHRYEGFDIDWEYPETTADRKLLVKLMQLLRDSNGDYTLSIDVAPWGGYGYDLKHLQLSLDYFNIMMDDCAAPWTAYGQLNSPLSQTCSRPAAQHGNALLRLSLHQHQPAFRIVSQRGLPSEGACDNTVLTVFYGPDLKHRINKDG